MSIHFTCGCGKSLNAPEGSGGKRARCPSCGAINTIPAPAVAADGDEYDLKPVADAPPARTFTPPAVDRIDPALAYEPESQSQSPIHQAMYGTPAEPPFWRKYIYFVLLLALLPLVVHTFVHEDEDEVKRRLVSTLKAHRDVPAIRTIVKEIEEEEAATNPDATRNADPNATAPGVAQAPDPAEADGPDVDDAQDVMQYIFRVLPEHKLDGAMLAYDSKAHWLMAAVSAAFFFTVMLLIFSSPGTKAHSIIFAGIFTGTIGILVLLGFQWCATNVAGANVRMWHGKAAIILLIIKFIGWSYYLADHPEYGFFASFLGYTAGVGLCEEFVKIIPVLLRIKSAPGKADATWQGLVLWGLASGVGFGVAEGIMYSGEHYNGYMGSSIYVVRFASCVVLHAVWTAAAAITVYNRQGSLHNSEAWGYIGNVIICIGISILLHGLYDVLLTQEHPMWALVVAVGSFGYLALQIERMRAKDGPAMRSYQAA